MAHVPTIEQAQPVTYTWTPPAASTAKTPKCGCGCGASLAGWSQAGAALGLRTNIRRVYRATHGTCYSCGSGLDQYGTECEVCV